MLILLYLIKLNFITKNKIYCLSLLLKPALVRMNLEVNQTLTFAGEEFEMFLFLTNLS